MTTLVFTRSTTLLSRLIRWSTNSAVSHVAIGTELAGVPVLVHADSLGVVLTVRSRFEARNEVAYEFEVTGLTTIGGAIEDVGTSYDYAGLLGMAFVMAARYLGRKIRNPFQSPKAFFCSEFVFSIDPLKSVKPWASLDPENTTPQDLLAVCLARPESFRKVK